MRGRSKGRARGFEANIDLCQKEQPIMYDIVHEETTIHLSH